MPPAPAPLRTAWRHFSSPLVIAGFVVLWQELAELNRGLAIVNPVFFPGPIRVVAQGVEMLGSGELQGHLSASMQRVVLGFVISAVLGVALGTLAARAPLVAQLMSPLISILRPIPPIALLPLMVVWLGVGELSKIGFIAYATFFQIFLTTVQGVSLVDPLLVRAAASLGTNRWRLFWRVVLPAAMPHIVTGLRLGFAMAFFVIVAAEFIGASAGLGYLIFASRLYFEIDKMLVSAAAIGVIGFTFDWLVRRVERRIFAWRLT